MELRRDVFQAIADPTRRAIIGLLSEAPQNLNAVAGHFEISRPAISRHMRILKECGLVSIKKKGRESYCRANLKAISEVAAWAAQYRKFWDQKLDTLENLLETDRS